MKHGSSGNGDIWTSFFCRVHITMEQNGLDLASVLEIFLIMHTSSQNAYACLCMFVRGEKATKESLQSSICIFCFAAVI